MHFAKAGSYACMHACPFVCVCSGIQCRCVLGDIFVEGYGEIHYDISYGGTFYIYTNIAQFGLNFKSPITDIVATCVKLRTAVTAEITISHPGVSDDLAFLYGVIMYTGPLDNSGSLEEICMYADGQVSAVTTLYVSVLHWKLIVQKLVSIHSYPGL